jgi:MoaA/NifB/PqqE/SkfB family radical SAM enzyme
MPGLNFNLHQSNWNLLQNLVDLKRNRILLNSRPYYIQLEVSSRCNINCIHCSREKFFGKGEDLDMDVLYRVERELLPYAKEFLISFYGEPLLHPNIEEIFGVVKRHPHLHSSFYTNALPLTEHMIDKILDAKFSYLNISIDGARKETYEKIRRGGSFDQLLKNLACLRNKRRAVKDYHLWLNMRIVGMRENIEEAPLFVELAKEYEFDFIMYYLNLTVDHPEMTHSPLNQYPELTNEMFRKAHERARELGIPTTFFETPFPKTEKQRLGRISPWKKYMQIIREHAARNFHRLNFKERLKGNFNQMEGSLPLFLILLAVKSWYGLTLQNFRLKKLCPMPNVNKPAYCGNPWTYINIRTNGEVLPCCFTQKSLGSLKKKSFEEIWNGPQFLELRRSIIKRTFTPYCSIAACNFIDPWDNEKYRYGMEAPASLEISSGVPMDLKIRVKNKGSKTWTPPGHHTQPERHFSLAYKLLSREKKLISEGIHTAIDRTLATGDSHVFTLRIYPIAAPGEYILQADMVEEHFTWFAERGQAPVEIPLKVKDLYHCRINFTDNCPQPPFSEQMRLSLTIHNLGEDSWISRDSNIFSLSFQWQNHDKTEFHDTGIRAPLPLMVNPGEMALVDINVESAPADAQTLIFDVVHEGVTWFRNVNENNALKLPLQVSR